MERLKELINVYDEKWSHDLKYIAVLFWIIACYRTDGSAVYDVYRMAEETGVSVNDIELITNVLKRDGYIDMVWVEDCHLITPTIINVLRADEPAAGIHIVKQ